MAAPAKKFFGRRRRPENFFEDTPRCRPPPCPKTRAHLCLLNSCKKVNYFLISCTNIPLSVMVWSYWSSPVDPPKTQNLLWKNAVAAPWTGNIWGIACHVVVNPATNCQLKNKVNAFQNFQIGISYSIFILEPVLPIGIWPPKPFAATANNYGTRRIISCAEFATSLW